MKLFLLFYIIWINAFKKIFRFVNSFQISQEEEEITAQTAKITNMANI